MNKFHANTVRGPFFAALAGTFGVVVADLFTAQPANFLPVALWVLTVAYVLAFGEPADERY